MDGAPRYVDGGFPNKCRVYLVDLGGRDVPRRFLWCAAVRAFVAEDRNHADLGDCLCLLEYRRVKNRSFAGGSGISY